MAPMASLAAVLLSLFVLPFGAVANPGWNGRPTAKTDAGTVVGFVKTDVVSGKKLNAFLGVPFGGQPARWGAPLPPAPWTMPLDASKLGPACVQQFNYPEPRRGKIIEWFNTPAPVESEDCLNLCVYAPLGPIKKPKAVMLWIYGGGLNYGSNAVNKYDASNLAVNEDVIVVVPNYRTNAFGFPGAVPQLPTTERNLGFLDQRLSLDWVQRNIAAFGGDPDQVTIFGESAGGVGVDALLTQPPEPLNFRAAIMESGTATFRGRPDDPAVGWKVLTGAMNCNTSSDVLGCMRALPTSQIKNFNEQNRTPWNPVFDNATLSDVARSNRLTSTATNSKVAWVPILGGTNAEEGKLYSVNVTDRYSFVRGLFPTATNASIDALVDAYTGYSNEFRQLAALYTDFIFQCPARLVHRDSSQVGIPSWRYYYNASFPNLNIFNDSGVYHSSEIALVMGTYPVEGATAYQRQLSSYIQGVWANFAKDPYNWGTPPWPQGVGAMGELGGGVRSESGPTTQGAPLTVLGVADIDYVDRHCGLYQAVYDVLGH